MRYYSPLIFDIDSRTLPNGFSKRFSKNVLKMQKTAPAEEEEDNQAQPVSIFLDLFEEEEEKRDQRPAAETPFWREKE